MRLKFLGTSGSQNGTCPSLYLADTGQYVVQGWRTDTNSVIEIPHSLLGLLEYDTFLDVALTDTGRGTFFIQGRALTDTEALAQMNIPSHEAAVVVECGKVIKPNAALAG